MRSTGFAIIVCGVLTFLAGCGPSTTEQQGLPPLQVVPSVDLPRYMGTWYEIANYPHRFQEGCTATRPATPWGRTVKWLS